MPYFDARHLPNPTEEYVAWVDVMGIQSAMGRSIAVAANFVFKLHIAALESKSPGVMLYPVMDGVYASSPSEADMSSFLRAVIKSLAVLFSGERNQIYRFIVRGGIARGQIHHGRGLQREASHVLANNPGHRDQVLLGQPMIDAHQGESRAPPFGIYVHVSARTALFGTSKEGWWRWFIGDEAFDSAAMHEQLRVYFDWCYERSEEIQYVPERILVHRGFSEHYLLRGV